jgi:hypothetical protein
MVQKKVAVVHFAKHGIFLFQKIKKYGQVVGIGDPGPGGSSRFNAAEKISTEGGQILHKFT